MNRGQHTPYAVVTVTNTDDEKRFEEALKSAHLSVCYHLHGQGTAPSVVMDIFGLSGSSRMVTICMVEKHNVQTVFKNLEEKMSFSQKGRGIAFSVPLTAVQGTVYNLLERGSLNMQDEEDVTMEKPVAYSAILVSVKNGYSDDVVKVARTVGARGGTIIKGMRECSSQSAETLGLPLKDEQSFVLILAPKEEKKTIMLAIDEQCGLKTPAQGTLFSFPVEDVLGIH